jgi:transposase
VLSGILFVLVTRVGWERLPRELGSGSGMTCWRRLTAWRDAGVWKRLHVVLLSELRAAGGGIDWSRAVVDASYIQAKRAPRRVRARSTRAAAARSTTC